MKLFLIDGHALIFKMYYAFLGRPMVNSRGEDTSILFGFTKYLLELIEKEQPTHLAVCFDPPGGTFRNKIYPLYKANRSETPPLVIAALEPLTEIVRSLGIQVLMVPGFEADDVVGTVALRSAAPGTDVYMVTPDKDYGQLVGAHVLQYRPGKAGSESEILGEAEICDKWKISSTSQVRDILTICGDTSDNVPGVQGVGPVGAAKLLAKYGSTSGIYEHLSELTPRQRGQFEAARDHIALSEELVTIRTDVPVEASMDSMSFVPETTAESLELMDRYEMPSLKRLLYKLSGSPKSAPASHASESVAIVYDRLSVGDFSSRVKACGEVALFRDGETLYAACGRYGSSFAAGEFRDVLEDRGIVKVGYDLKLLLNALAGVGIRLEGRLQDVKLMHYLINPERSHDWEAIVGATLHVNLGSSGGASEQGSLFDEESDTTERDFVRDAVSALRLRDSLVEEMKGCEGLTQLYDKIEEPLVRVLSGMEVRGVKVDMDSLADFAESLRRKLSEKESEVRELAGEPSLNVSSPKQVGTVVFEKLALDPKAKKPRSGNWPTDEQTLLALSDRSPIIDAILDYRGIRKLLSTYIEPFGGYVSRVDGRVHTSFNQMVTSTGRLSSSNPNLQNIPIRTELGREIRKAFVAQGPDAVMMSADYSQIELRLMAHFSGDAHLTEAFRSGVDVHSATASKIFGVPLEEVTAEQRRVAKTANFGIMYGISAFGLSQRLRCSRSEAKKIIDDYFTSFPSIRDFIDSTIASARRDGYVETLFGRRRYISDITSPNATVRALAERNAVNAPIQGSAADIIKLAMVAVDKDLSESSMKSRTVLQIHDELLLEVSGDEIEKARDVLVSRMEGVVSLSVPLTVECNYGKTWLDAH